MSDQGDADAIRFRLLCELCRSLRGFGCSSYLVNPTLGGAVLRVDRADRTKDKLGVGAVEHHAGWVYAWDGKWATAGDLDQVARLIAREVSA